MVEHDEMNLIMLCRKMNWTWTQLADQPTWFIDHLIVIINEEAKVKPK